MDNIYASNSLRRTAQLCACAVMHAVQQADVSLCMRHGVCVDARDGVQRFYYKGLCVIHDPAAGKVVRSYWGLLEHIKRHQQHFKSMRTQKPASAKRMQNVHKQKVLMLCA
jgi:hypothetical protein